MTLREKIALSRQPDRFTLHREGLFYTCYDEDAMVFVKHIKPYKVTSRWVKSIGAVVLRVGFPAGALQKDSLSLEQMAASIGAVQTEQDDQRLVW
jgi:hypothetical protein